MRNKLANILFMLTLIFASSAIVCSVVPTAPLLAAAPVGKEICDDANFVLDPDHVDICADEEPIENSVILIINVALFIAGVLAVAYLIFGGFKYVMSTGDAGKLTSAKQTIQYAITGIIICIIAYAIVNFVVGAIL